MPKKFANENSKAVAARQRKQEKAEAEKTKKAQAAEDALWADDDKSLQKKQARKDDAERKKQDALQKKKEREELLAREEAEEKERQAKKGGQTQKISRAQIREDAERREAIARGQAAKEKQDTHLSKPLEENINRVEVDGVEARTLDEAISALNVKGASSPAVDKHPEKRMKAAYEDFEKDRLPALKSENPTLRMSQLKQILRKEWMKHPNNPLNVKLAAIQSGN